MPQSFLKRDIVTVMIIAALLILAIINVDYLWALVGQIISVLSPVLIGLAFAFLINLLMVKFEKVLWPESTNKWARRLRRPLAILLSLLLITLIIAFLLILVVPQLIDAGQTLVEVVPVWFNKAVDYLQQLSQEDPEFVRNLEAQVTSQGAALWERVQNNAASLGAGILNTGIGIFNGLFNVVIGLIIAVYILADKENLGRQVNRLVLAYFPEKVGRRFRTLTEVAEDVFSNYVIGQSIDAFILGVMCFIGMSLLGLPYAAMIATVVGFTNIVPIVGPYVGAMVGAFVLLTDGLPTVLIFIIFVVVIQQIDGNLIMPRVVGGSVGLPALWVLIAIIVMGGLFGFLGVLVAVPVASTIYRLMGLHIQSQLDQKKETLGPEMNFEADRILEERAST